ncbi:MAG: hypothetical protein FWH40_03265 [Coriobacteriia bacterium]|nr:hypothetical protein [Coriobacteriia bacterium]
MAVQKPPKPTVTLVSLYSDYLNLYGENGNIKVLASALQSAGLEVAVKHFSLHQTIDLSACDFLYIGSGIEARQLTALSHLRQNREALKEYVEKDGLVLCTGNAADMFGQQIVTPKGESVEALGLFDYQARQLQEREVGEVLFSFLDEYLVGFQNRGSQIECHDSQAKPLFNVNKGFCTVFRYDEAENTGAGEAYALQEGFRLKGFIASSVLGLVTRNPAFILWLVRQILSKKLRSEEGFSDLFPTELLQEGNDEGLVNTVTKSTTSAYQLLDLQLDIVAFWSFLGAHHSILNS